MISMRRIPQLLGMSAAVMLYAHLANAQVLPTTTQSPDAFGTNSYTITTIPAVSFTGGSFYISGSVGRFGAVNVDQHFYAALDIPAGVKIDYIGLNNLNDGTPGVISAQVFNRADTGGGATLAAISSSAHASWQTDKNSDAFDSTYTGHFSNGNAWVLIVDVKIAASPNLQFFGWVEVWWRRIVSYPPGVATFSDVPTSHPFFQFVEAIHAAGITNGYPDGRFGVNDPITRGQMAVYLAAALGLHWPN